MDHQKLLLTQKPHCGVLAQNWPDLIQYDSLVMPRLPLVCFIGIGMELDAGVPVLWQADMNLYFIQFVGSFSAGPPRV